MPRTEHCCAMMTTQVNWECADHPNRYDCPDVLVNYSSRLDRYGLIIHDGGSSVIAIAFCPWCGASLPEGDLEDRDVEYTALSPTEAEILAAYDAGELPSIATEAELARYRAIACATVIAETET